MTAKFTKMVGAAGIALTTLAGAANAESLEWSVTGTGTSDYVFRGISTNDEDPAFQASIDLTYGIWYGSLWGSVVADPYGPAELNLITGITPKLGPVTFDFGLVYYFYPWAEDKSVVPSLGPSDFDLIELKAGLEFSPVKNLTLTPVFWYVPDQSNSDAIYTIEGTAAYELPALGIFTPTISGGVGYTESDNPDQWDIGVDNYSYWNAGVALAVEKFTFDFRYWDTDLDNNPLADERFVFTASVTLP
ncbi:TorF family putative porin [Hyphomicrobium sp.]|uniref:TorF family putative porin n=1 Tax=Hyphomicrobium sp. TaxID=82 RepID=UPI0025C267D1|nr:TorF family putative porin [Hyphomicrobium sp.]MCC7253425.1 hypothetical protein [Hyphomicrobium sp.]